MPPGGECPEGTYQVGVTPDGSPICCPDNTNYNSATGACDSPTTTGTGTEEPCDPNDPTNSCGFLGTPVTNNDQLEAGVDYGTLCDVGCMCDDGSGGIIYDCEGNGYCCCAEGAVAGIQDDHACCAAYESAGGQPNWECICSGGYGGGGYINPEDLESAIASNKEECEGYHESCVFTHWSRTAFDGDVEFSFSCECEYKIDDANCEKLEQDAGGNHTGLRDCENNGAGLFWYTNCAGIGSGGQANPLP